MTEWSETDKALWILEHGEPDIKWIYERNGEKVYKRPINDFRLPPWVSREREFFTKLNDDK